MSASGTVQSNWTGMWHGIVEAYPEDALGVGFDAKWEIGAYPMTDNSCTTWRATYSKNGEVQIAKDNKLCRGDGPDDLFVQDGGSGQKIAVQKMNNVLVSAFKINGVFSVVRMRMRGDILEEEVLVSDDNPGTENTIVSLRTHSIHLISLKRMSTCSNEENCFQP